MHKSILIVTHDPGGTKAIIPLIKALHKQKRLQIHCYAGPFASAILGKNKIKFTSIESNIDQMQAEEIWQKSNPEILLTATSWNSNLEQTFRNIAAARSKSSYVFLDFWDSYKERWSGSSYPIKKTPDRILVVDSSMKKQMVLAGFPQKNIFAVGHPHLGSMKRMKSMSSNKQTPAALDVVFISERLTKKVIGHLKNHPIINILESLSDIQVEHTTKLNVLYRFHPKEPANKFLSKILNNYKTSLHLKIVPQEIPFERLLKKYQYFIGYRSMALLEARIAGKNVLSIPLLKENVGFSAALKSFQIPHTKTCNKKEIKAAMRKWLHRKPSNLAAKYANATTKALKLILS